MCAIKVYDSFSAVWNNKWFASKVSSPYCNVSKSWNFLTCLQIYRSTAKYFVQHPYNYVKNIILCSYVICISKNVATVGRKKLRLLLRPWQPFFFVITLWFYTSFKFWRINLNIEMPILKTRLIRKWHNGPGGLSVLKLWWHFSKIQQKINT